MLCGSKQISEWEGYTVSDFSQVSNRQRCNIGDSLYCSQIHFAYPSFLSLKQSLVRVCPVVALAALKAERTGVAVSIFTGRT